MTFGEARSWLRSSLALRLTPSTSGLAHRLSTPKKKKEAKYRKRLAADADVLNATLNPVLTTPVNVFGRAVIGFPGDRPTTGLARSGYLAQQMIGDLNAIQV